MKNQFIYLIILLLLGACKVSNDCETNLQKATSKIGNLNLEIKVLKAESDSLTYLNEELESYKDSIDKRFEYLSQSWEILVGMFDSVVKLPPDTFWFRPQCTLFYESIDTIGGYQFYIGYDGRHYRLFQEMDTIRQVFYTFEKDTVRYKYRFVDSTMYVDSIIHDATGAVVLWAHTLCEKYMKDSCQSRLVLGHVLTGTGVETVGISFLSISGERYQEGKIYFPKILVTINDTTNLVFSNDGEGYKNMLYLGYKEIRSITLTPILEPNQGIYIRSVVLNTLKLNSPKGWNVSYDEGIEYLGNTFFVLNYGSKIRFEKP